MAGESTLRLAELGERSDAIDAAPGPGDGEYQARPEGLFYVAPGGKSEIALTNFRARIVARTTIEDQPAPKVVFDIEADAPGGQVRFQVSPRAFDSLGWVTERVPGGVLWPAGGVKGHVRTAILALSDPIERKVVKHLGWYEVEGQHVFLHAKGMIGSSGVEPIGIEVERPFDRYVLPEPLVGDDLRRAVGATVELLDLAPNRIMVPLVAGAVRSVLGPCDFALHLHGLTGTGKSQVAGIAQSFFGAKMATGLDLPATWSSTANAIEAMAFTAKDALLCVDDWVPGSGQGSEPEFDRLVRAASNQGGRARLDRATYHPRGLILSTGEAVPRLPSLVARLVTIRMEPGDLNWKALPVAQGAAREGIHAGVLSSFIAWLAPQLDQIRSTLDQRVHDLRPEFSINGLHLRSTTALAHLAAAWETFAGFLGKHSEVDTDHLTRIADEALHEVAWEQLEVQQAGDPARLFVARVSHAVASRRVSLAPVTQPVLGDYQIGWWRDDELLLDPERALRCARDARPGGDALAVSLTDLGSDLHRAGLLHRIDGRGSRIRFRVRVLIGGKRRGVWAFDTRAFGVGS